jgi:hypothetical protein
MRFHYVPNATNPNECMGLWFNQKQSNHCQKIDQTVVAVTFSRQGTPAQDMAKDDQFVRVAKTPV